MRRKGTFFQYRRQTSAKETGTISQSGSKTWFVRRARARPPGKKCFELFQNASNFSRRCLSAFGTNPRPVLPLRRPRQINYRWKQKINVSIHGEHTPRDIQKYIEKGFLAAVLAREVIAAIKVGPLLKNLKRFPRLLCSRLPLCNYRYLKISSFLLATMLIIVKTLAMFNNTRIGL